MPRDPRSLKLFLAVNLCAIAACTGIAASVDEPCNFVVDAVRPPRADDVPLDDHHPLLRRPESANRVPGPGSFQAVVKSDSLHHPHIYIEDTSTGKRRLLRRGSQPRWSPDGKRIACVIWESIQRPWLLCIVDVATARSFVPELNCLTMNFEWAPDGNTIAVGAVLYGQSTNVLCLVSLPSGTSRIVDTLSVFSDYQFAWSPDSRHLAVQRPTRVIDEEEPSAADLWIFDGSGRKCQLTHTPDYVESEPKWIDRDRLLCMRQLVQGSRRGQETLAVLELGRRRPANTTRSGGSP